MTVRPHCLRCGSANVIMDEDVLNGRTSVYCYLCGNRQYKGTDYIGFEMREETMRGTCKNCNRSGLHIVKEGFCAPCFATSAKNPDQGPDRDQAMATAAKRAATLPGPHTIKPKAQAGKRVHPTEPAKPAAEPGKKTDIAVRRCRVCGCTDDDCSNCMIRTGNPCRWVEDDLCSACVSIAVDAEPIMLTVRFAGRDVSLFRVFEEYSALHRRDPADQILCLIDDVVRAERVNRQPPGVLP